MDFLSGIVVGILGSLHCAAMCGPIALALPAGESQRRQFVVGRLLYNAGRIVTYVVLGAILGSLGGLFALAGLQQAVSIAVGAIMILALAFPSVVHWTSARWSPAARLHTTLRAGFSMFLHRRTLSSLFGLGLLNGLLPCGLLYAALGAAMALGESLRGIVFLGGFGAGTLPIMLGIGLLGKTINVQVRRRLSGVLPVFTVALGLLLILRGLNLGIPYISPEVHEGSQGNIEAPCH
jgi:sulfite exporter TauE/SafE